MSTEKRERNDKKTYAKNAFVFLIINKEVTFIFKYFLRSVQIYSINGSSLSEKHLENLNCDGDEHELNSCSNVHWKSSCVAGNSLGLKCCMFLFS